jgi:catechol 2,3-dioxygenase-like lactoylglutathione lyase family enzyme
VRLNHITLAVSDVEASAGFYVRLVLTQIVASYPDKPTVTLETPPDPDRVSSFLNLRVADIEAVYAKWSARGAEFLTPPKEHETEIRCYIRDPDGYIIEVGQTTLARGWRPPS